MNDWRNRLLAAVSPLESGVRGLQVNGYRRPDGEACRPSRTAAVLVAFLDLPDPELILTRRAEHLLQHPGQICFPGGAAEDNDRTAVQTALREAEEEIGLPPHVAKPIGFLDRMDTISDYRVLPVVALVSPPVHWVLDRREVAEVFTVPASVALDRRRYLARTLDRDGHRYTVWSLRWREYDIWGATASMLLNLIARIEQSAQPESKAGYEHGHTGICGGT
jgi:8-oxo-dGTP pyrophosphatase MutT (NUDIX family)